MVFHIISRLPIIVSKSKAVKQTGLWSGVSDQQRSGCVVYYYMHVKEHNALLSVGLPYTLESNSCGKKGDLLNKKLNNIQLNVAKRCDCESCTIVGSQNETIETVLDVTYPVDHSCSHQRDDDVEAVFF